MNIQQEIDKIKLDTGKHDSLAEGACVMEMVSYLANEPWSDHPKCACPLLTRFAISYNDRVSDKDRQKLKVLIPKLLNSRDKAKEKDRAEFFALKAITVFLPLLTEALGLVEITTKLRSFQMGQWIEARDYINSVKPEIRKPAAAYAAAYAAADAYAAAAAAYAATAATAATAAAADATYAAADAAYAAYAAAYAAKSKFWKGVRQNIHNEMFKVLSEACDL